MDPRLPLLLALIGAVVACGATSIDEDRAGGGTAAGGPGGAAGGASGAGGSSAGGRSDATGGTSTGGAATTGGTPNVGGSPPVACGCAPVTLAADQLFPASVAVDATTVYFTVNTGSLGWTIMKVPLTGGAPVSVAPWEPLLLLVAIDRTSIYGVMEGTIRAAPIAGGPSVEIVPSLTDLEPSSPPQDFAIDETHIYWSIQTGGIHGAVFKAPLTGGDPVRIASVPDGTPGDIALDATHVYWVSYGLPSVPAVMKVPKGGGDATALAPGGDFVPNGIAVGPDRVYWTQFPPGFPNSSGAPYQGLLLEVPLAGGTPVELASRAAMPGDLAFDGTDLYWGIRSTSLTIGTGSLTDGAVLRTTPGGVTTTVMEAMNPGRIATHGRTVCWPAAHWLSFGGMGAVVCVRPCDGEVCQGGAASSAGP